MLKYDATKPASIVVGKDTFTQRAEGHPDFRGYRAGVLVQRGQSVVEEEGAFLMPGDRLLGGWFEGYRGKFSQPFRHKVSMQEYSKQQSTWRSMPATMIRKVVLVQGLREMFPAEFAGLYDQAEMGADIDLSSPGESPPAAQITDGGPASDEPVPSTAAYTVPEGAEAPVVPQSYKLGGYEWVEHEHWHTWSTRGDDGYVKLGNWVLQTVFDAIGVESKKVNYDLKVKYGVTASALTPAQADEFLASLGLIDPGEPDDLPAEEPDGGQDNESWLGVAGEDDSTGAPL